MSDLRLEQQLKSQVMSHFCYDYAKRLYEKLLQLKDEGQLFRNTVIHQDSTIADCIIRNLANQIKYSDRVRNSASLDSFLEVAGEYLAIFEDDSLTSRQEKFLLMPVRKISFGSIDTRIQNGLCENNITFFLDLVVLFDTDILNMPSMGRKVLNGIKEKLEEFDLYLGMSFK